ncbi:MAG: DUF167 domain-containing protein [Syntrophobacterales bacterium]|nr:DUF167 domain-containing protein [Syntrophobacterales bacterium]
MRADPREAFFAVTCQGYLVRVQAVPGAGRTEVAGLVGDRLKIRLAAPPEKGAANRELLAFLAARLGLPRQAVRLLHGAGSRAKLVAVDGLEPELWQRLRQLLPEGPDRSG